MNPKQLQTPEGMPVNAFVCGACGSIWTESQPYMATKCCQCDGCGKKLNAREFTCYACRRSREAKRDMERMEKAVEAVGYTGPVFDGEDYHESVLDLSDKWHGKDVDMPEFVFGVTLNPWYLDADDILQNLVENAGSFEDEADINGKGEFCEAVDEFNKANEGNNYWEEDATVKVRVPKIAKGE